MYVEIQFFFIIRRNKNYFSFYLSTYLIIIWIQERSLGGIIHYPLDVFTIKSAIYGQFYNVMSQGELWILYFGTHFNNNRTTIKSKSTYIVDINKFSDAEVPKHSNYKTWLQLNLQYIYNDKKPKSL